MTTPPTAPAETKPECECATMQTPGVDLNEFFAQRFKAGLMNNVSRHAIDALLESKAIEFMSGLQLLDNAPSDPKGKLRDQVAHHLVFIVSSLCLNLDMEKIKAAIQPCGHPDCKCEETKATIVGSLIMMRDYLREIEKRGYGQTRKVGAR